MTSSPFPEPDGTGNVITVGRDRAGHWLVQDRAGRLEGRFISFATAVRYAEGECHALHAALELARVPLSPLVPFRPVGADERAPGRPA